jgi:hypothetical protein
MDRFVHAHQRSVLSYRFFLALLFCSKFSEIPVNQNVNLECRNVAIGMLAESPGVKERFSRGYFDGRD